MFHVIMDAPCVSALGPQVPLLAQAQLEPPGRQVPPQELAQSATAGTGATGLLQVLARLAPPQLKGQEASASKRSFVRNAFVQF